MKRRRAFAGLMILAAGLSFGQTKRFQLSLFGGVNHVLAYGSDDDYVLGSNDFPVTPSHTPANFGTAFTYFLNGRLGIELRGEYALASSLSLTDPSDQDSVSIKSARHMAFSLNMILELSEGKIRPYLAVGGGADKLSSDSVTAVSKYGYEVTFAPPDKTLSFFANAGGGLRFPVFSTLGFDIDLRYRLLRGDPDRIHSLIAGLGCFWKF
jgi:outer membrane protein W